MILHTYWYVAENDQKDPWHWAGVYISLGMSLGLTERITYANEDFKTRKLWRRLFWCCYLRDRILSTTARRPMRYKDEDIHIPMLILDDFDLNTPTTTISAVKDAFSVMTYDCKAALAHLCMAQIQLASINGRVVDSLYILQVFGGSTSGPKILYSPKGSGVDPKDVASLESELERWRVQLPQACQMQPSQKPDQQTGDVLYLHQSYLKLIHLLITEALHRPLSLSRGEATISRSLLQQKSRPVVRKCATATAEVVHCLRERDLFRFLPPIAGTCIGAAIAYFLIDTKSTEKSSEESSGLTKHDLQQCIRALWSLREVWPIADSACRIVGHMIRASEVETARIIGLQASPIPTEIGSFTSTEMPSLSSAVTTPVDEPQGESDAAGNEIMAAHSGGAVGLDATFLSCEANAFDHINYDELWSLSNQMPWTLTEFGVYEDQFQEESPTSGLLDSGYSV